MNFIKLTIAKSGLPIFINKEHIVSFQTLNDSRGYTDITLTGVESAITVEEKIVDVEKLLDIEQKVKVTGTGGWTKS